MGGQEDPWVIKITMSEKSKNRETIDDDSGNFSRKCPEDVEGLTLWKKCGYFIEGHWSQIPTFLLYQFEIVVTRPLFAFLSTICFIF